MPYKSNGFPLISSRFGGPFVRDNQVGFLFGTLPRHWMQLMKGSDNKMLNLKHCVPASVLLLLEQDSKAGQLACLG